MEQSDILDPQEGVMDDKMEQKADGTYRKQVVKQ